MTLNAKCFGKWKVYGIIFLFLGLSMVPSATSLQPQQYPATIKTADPPVYWHATPPDGMDGWYRIGVTLTCTYDHNLIAEVDYRYTGTEWQVYTSAVNITTEGIIEFEWYCVYTNGTVSRPQGPIYYRIDRTPPEIEVEYERVGRNKIEYEVEVSDGNLSGLDRIEFWIGPYLQFTQTFTNSSGEQNVVWILSPIPHINVTITIKIYDLAGNMNSWNYTTSLSLSQGSILQRLQDIFSYYQGGAGNEGSGNTTVSCSISLSLLPLLRILLDNR
jgi:hypothetical protein